MASNVGKAYFPTMSTHDDLLDRYASQHLSGDLGNLPSTIRLRLYYVRRLLNDHQQMSAISGPTLSQWLHQQSWGPSTRKSAIASWRQFFSWARRERLIITDPTEHLGRVRVPQGEPRPAPSEPLRAAINASTDRDALILALGAFAGLRRSEIAALQWTDITWSGLRIRGKGRKTRLIPLLPELRERLDREAELRQLGAWGTGWRYRPDPASPYVFPGARGGHMTPDRVARIVRLAMPGYSPHTLRHRFATKAYAVERDLLTVQRLLGHSSPITTTIYTAPPGGAALRAVEGSAVWDDAA